MTSGGAAKATWAHSARPAPGPGSRSKTTRSGYRTTGPPTPAGRGVAAWSMRHCGTWSSKAAIWAICSNAAGESTSGYRFGPSECTIVA